MLDVPNFSFEKEFLKGPVKKNCFYINFKILLLEIGKVKNPPLQTHCPHVI